MRGNHLLISSVCGLFLGLSWFVPGDAKGAVCSWAFGLSLAYAVVSCKAGYRSVYLSGVFAYCLGFYWLVETFSNFGGFNLLASSAIFALFVTLSSVQFLLFLFAYRNFPTFLRSSGLSLALAWSFSEFASIRIFPWYLGHSQLGFPALAQIADLGGAPLISFLVLWFSEGFIRIFSEGFKKRFALPLLLLALSVVYGVQRISEFQAPPGEKQSVAVIQGNVSIVEKHDIKMVEANVSRYLELTKKVARDNLLVIWPESVITEWISIYSRSTAEARNFPALPQGISFLTGALTIQDNDHFFNSALGVLSDGKILPPYHKQILMPFGEFTPFSETFPWLREIHFTPEFTPGEKIEVFSYPATTSTGVGNMLRLSPLICYEDILPRLSTEAVNRGAELLVNLTNDAWFGDSLAPYQHNQIAAFRAIENRRYLIRSTNTGLTAIIDPTGQTVSQLQPFSEGVLEATVTLIGSKTVYSAYVGDNFGVAVVLLSLLMIVYQTLQRLRGIKR